MKQRISCFRELTGQLRETPIGRVDIRCTVVGTWRSRELSKGVPINGTTEPIFHEVNNPSQQICAITLPSASCCDVERHLQKQAFALCCFLPGRFIFSWLTADTLGSLAASLPVHELPGASGREGRSCFNSVVSICSAAFSINAGAWSSMLEKSTFNLTMGVRRFVQLEI